MMGISGENKTMTEVSLDLEGISAVDSIEALVKCIENVDKEGTLKELNFMKEIVLVHNDLFAHINTPATIKMLHDSIVEKFGINRKFLQLRRRILNKRKNAECFIQAMINGVTSYNA